MCWPIPLSERSFRRAAAPTPGRRTPMNFASRPGTTIPSRTPAGEAFYIRDEQTGQFWSPTPWPARGATPYVIRHGFGYTVFEHFENGIVSELWVYVAMDAPVKFTSLKLRNVSGGPRRLSVTGYWEWVLGDLRHKTLLQRADRSGPEDRRIARAQFLQHRIPGSHRVPRCQRPEPHPHRRPEGIPRPERKPGATRGAEARAAFRQSRARAWILAARCRSPSIWRTGRNERPVSASASVATRAKCSS